MRRENSPQNAAGHTFVILTIIIRMDKHQTADHCLRGGEREAAGEHGCGRKGKGVSKGEAGKRAIEGVL